ncbi:hypothetical protein FQR65_LT15150 [Abscondita terminalis]|nr:hypothetical protein FQR65_LT15150 [Abscondita terminalis]
MAPNTDIQVTDSTNQMVQFNLPLWITDCLSMSVTNSQVWTSDDWVKSLQKGVGEADVRTLELGYQQLTDQFNRMLYQPNSTDENGQNDWVTVLLRQLLMMHVYLETIVKYHPYLIQANRWVEQVFQVITITPKKIYLNQLGLLVEEALGEKYEKQSTNQMVDRALFKIYERTLILYFQQLLDCLRNTQVHPPCDEQESEYESYIRVICMLHAYITQLSSLPLTETEHLPSLLLDQLTQLIKITSTLDLSPSWMERLRQWIQWCFNKLKLWHVTTPTAAASSSSLLAISRQLRKSTEEVVRKKKLHSLNVIRERCWLYFSLHEQLISQWCNEEERHALEYHSTALDLFESFMSTFECPSTFNKGILRENPLMPYRSAKFNRKQVTPVQYWESLLDIALNKLGTDLFIRGWFIYNCYSNRASLLHWLVSRQEPRLMAVVKDYVKSEERDFQRDEISNFDKRNLYRFVQATYRGFCADVNLITQMILSVWFKKIGVNVSHTDLAAILSRPGRWLHQKKQEPPSTQWEDTIPHLAFTLYQAIERLGVGYISFRPFNNIGPHYKKRYQSTHHKSKASRDSVLLNLWAQRYIPRIQFVKEKLQKFRKLEPDELQSENAEAAADLLLRRLKSVVVDGMYCHLRSMQWIINALSLSPEELQREHTQKKCDYINKIKQIDVEIAKARKGEKEARRDREKMRIEREEIDREIEAGLEKVARLEALLAERTQQAQPVPANVTKSGMTLFSAAPPKTPTEFNDSNPVLTKAH